MNFLNILKKIVRYASISMISIGLFFGVMQVYYQIGFYDYVVFSYTATYSMLFGVLGCFLSLNLD